MVRISLKLEHIYKVLKILWIDKNLIQKKILKKYQSIFWMTLQDLARQWFTSAKFTSYDEMKKKFTQEYSEYGKTPYEWLKSWTKTEILTRYR